MSHLSNKINPLRIKMWGEKEAISMVLWHKPQEVMTHQKDSAFSDHPLETVSKKFVRPLTIILKSPRSVCTYLGYSNIPMKL